MMKKVEKSPLEKEVSLLKEELSIFTYFNVLKIFYQKK